MRKGMTRVLSMALCLIMLISTIPVVSVSAAGDKLEAYDAYYEYLKAEIASLGSEVRDSDYYKMLTPKASNAKTQKILACYFKDVTNDGIEELILKRYVTHKSGAALDLSDKEWVCIYSYVNGQIKRIGQNDSWVKQNKDNSYSYYEPTGYIGNILSSYDYPHISDDCVYYCKGSNGKVYLADNDPEVVYDETCTFYTYNGNYMAPAAEFKSVFVHDYWYGIQLLTGTVHYYIDGVSVNKSTFDYEKSKYISGGVTKLVNNNYTTVLNKLKDETKSLYTPSGWASTEVNAAIDKGYVPENIQKKYTNPITRAEFCALATCMYESITGMEITERAEFKDTTDVNVQKMGGLAIVNGTGNGNFSPNSNLTRQEAATILDRLGRRLALRLKTGNLNYADNNKIADWAKSAVATISATGVMKGVDNNKFNPTGSYTREQAILTIYRLSNIPFGDPILVSGVSLNKSTLTTTVGGTATLSATVTPDDATDSLVTWSSSNSKVATVSKAGLMTAVAEGTAVITASTSSGHSATCNITVGPVKATAISLNKTTAFANIGRTVQLTPSFTPANASTKHTTWTSSNTSVATVSSSGLVTAIAEGTTTITAEAFGKKATCKFTVSTEPLGLENFNKDKTYKNQFSDVPKNEWYYQNVKSAYEYSLMNGTSDTTFNPTGNLSIAEVITIASRIHNIYHDNNSSFSGSGAWYQGYVDYAIANGIIKSGDYSNYEAKATRLQFALILANSVPSEALAPINNVGDGIPDLPPETAGAKQVYMLYNAGILSGSSAYGNFNPNSNIMRSEVAAIITRIADIGLRKTFTLLPTTIPATALALDKGSIGLVIGESSTLNLVPTPSNATTTGAKWTTSNSSVATVSDGKVTAVGAGSATITVTLGSLKATCNVAVLAEYPTFSKSNKEGMDEITLPQGAYYIEYTKVAGKKFTASTIWNWGYDSEIVTDYNNTSGRGFIAAALKEDKIMDLNISASGDWTAKICPINESGSTNLKGSGCWVGGMFRATQSKYTAKLWFESAGWDLYFYRVDSPSCTTVWSWDLQDDGSATFNLTEGGYYVPVIVTPGEWTVDLGVGDAQEIVN